MNYPGHIELFMYELISRDTYQKLMHIALDHEKKSCL
jgi:hypothetical protein